MTRNQPQPSNEQAPGPRGRASGFSFVEVLIVMAIIAVLVGAVLIVIGMASRAGDETATQARLASAYSEVASAPVRYQIEDGEIREARPWRRDDGGFAQPETFHVFSMGPDGRPNTDDDLLHWKKN